MHRIERVGKNRHNNEILLYNCYTTSMLCTDRHLKMLAKHCQHVARVLCSVHVGLFSLQDVEQQLPVWVRDQCVRTRGGRIMVHLRQAHSPAKHIELLQHAVLELFQRAAEFQRGAVGSPRGRLRANGKHRRKPARRFYAQLIRIGECAVYPRLGSLGQINNGSAAHRNGVSVAGTKHKQIAKKMAYLAGDSLGRDSPAYVHGSFSTLESSRALC